MAKNATLTIQQWGNSLAVRIPASVARSVGFSKGQPAALSVKDSAVLVKKTGEPRLTLSRKLALFDPAQHGGEAMTTTRVGREAL